MTNSTVDLLMILLKATGNHVYKSIERKRDQEAYINGMEICISLASIHGHNIQDLISAVQISQVSLPHVNKSIFSFSSDDPRKYFMLAHEHALDAIRSIARRFVTGDSFYYVSPDKVWASYPNTKRFL